MKYSSEFQSVCQIDKRKWILVVVLVAVTHLFCQTLMLPYGNALHSLLSESNIQLPEKVSLSSKESSVVESTKVGESFSGTLSSFDDVHMLAHRLKTVDNGDVSEDGEIDESVNEKDEVKPHSNHSVVKTMENDSDFVEDAILENDNLFDEVVDMDEETTMQKNNESRRDLSLEQVVKTNGELSADPELDANRNSVLNDTKAASVTNSSSVVASNHLDNLPLVTIGEINFIRTTSNNSSTGDLTQLLPNHGNHSLVQSTVKKKMRCMLPPKTITSISQMERLLVRHRARSRAMRPRWSSERDKEILAARLQIENAPLLKNDRELYAPAFRNMSMFKRSYELMERILKVYVYKEGEKPIFHQPIMKGLYASEGWFMKLMEGNNKFVVKDPRKAHLFYLPFSSRMLEHSLYVRNSHNRTNLRQYLKDYSEKIAAKYRFWNRTGGADHFLAACHDWAPYETRHHMEHCIKALCNADVTLGFKIGRDVSLPETYVRSARNPLRDLGGKPPSQRKVLAFCAGNMHGYLRPILLEHWKDKDPDMEIFGPMPSGVASKMNYIQHMKSSKFCICPKGYEVNSPRVVEAIFYECVPVIISDNFVPPFFGVLNWDTFSLILAEKDIPNLKSILLSIPEKKYLDMQIAVRKVQRHFLWHAKPVKYDLFHMTLHSIWYNRVFQTKAR
ncbi:probable glycosyltransferase At3g07620 isoform X1 [Solanum verrucosum]|uniref:probable glycosyltransferase At3g07620 isoform X1 n=2 Tax=Solanum verrucosum TaxID=315347 RepID=UPI0020D18F2D|nr:probable glycosyltransferase At3g07620 isoform X1 [Solanum verrucosum]XP_049347382.1 probable glycosyltransferase At3g07620 isoform X1 [Solanum verrucosum]XP_049347383.1 probable glycosyltransferase At3g07620 isoform X1 [Solanum verrucosum]